MALSAQRNHNNFLIIVEYRCRHNSYGGYIYNTGKPIFHCKLGSHWVTNTNEMSTNNMKCTWPMRKVCIGDPTQTLLHWLALGFCIGGNANITFRVEGNANFRVFRYQHVSRPYTQCKFCVGSSRWLRPPTRGPNASVFASK